MKRVLEWFFSRREETLSWLQVIGWWEIRRIPYNLIVLFTGVASFLLFLQFIDLAHELRLGEDAVEPLALLAGWILANVFYTGGWIVELASRGIRQHTSSHFGPTLLKSGGDWGQIFILEFRGRGGQIKNKDLTPIPDFSTGCKDLTPIPDSAMP